ncbi:large conductance calcium-activated potassium channel [Aureococcus anophagefferens]|nr:large conductance calcium-activated potassium channel [Aureococcus anophagefferens]
MGDLRHYLFGESDGSGGGAMTHKQRGRMRSSAILRDFVHIGSVHVIYSTVNATATIASVVGYIQGTYHEQRNTSPPEWEQRLQSGLLVWFFFIFFFELFIAYDRHEHMSKLVTICDFLSVLPIMSLVVEWSGAKGDNSEKLLKFLAIFRAFRVLRFLRLHRLLSFYSPGVMRQVLALLLIIFCALFVLTGCVYQLEGISDINGVSQFTEDPLSFLEAFYFVIITFTTVGYGDIYPQQIISRLIVAVAVPIAVVAVPTIGSQIYDLVAAQSPYATAGRIHTHGDWHHIVVVGELGANDEKLGRQLPVLLEQLYHPERGSVDIELQVVLLQHHDPPATVRERVLQHPYYSERVKWVSGSVFEEAHLRQWVAGARAVCFINLANLEISAPAEMQAEDNARRCSARSSSAARSPSGKGGKDGSNGFDTISRSFTEELTKALDVDYVPERLMPKFSDMYETPAEEELAIGQHATVHEVAEIPREAIGMRFDELSRLAYLHFGVLPVAVSTSCGVAGGGAAASPTSKARTSAPWLIQLDDSGAECNKTRGSAHVVNFPYDYQLRHKDTLLVVARDTQAVNDFETWNDFQSRADALDEVWDSQLFPCAKASRSKAETDAAEAELTVAHEMASKDYESALRSLGSKVQPKVESSHRNLQLLVPACSARELPRAGGAGEAKVRDDEARDRPSDLTRSPGSEGGSDGGGAPFALGEGTAQAAMAEACNLETWTEAARVAYLDAWFGVHVVDEAPPDLSGHVVFCGPVHSLMCFLQPLMFANIEWNNGTDAPPRELPKVVVLDPQLRYLCANGDSVESDGARSRFEAITFYEPDADGPPTRLWIVAGDPREGRAHSGHLAPLERCRVEAAQSFVLPNNNFADVANNLNGDDFAVRAVRNVQEIIARVRGVPLDAPWRYVPDFRPRMLIEMHDATNARYLRYNAPSMQFKTGGEIVEPTFLDSAVVNVYHSSAALPFTLHAICSWRDDGLLYHERLRDGIVRESCHISLVDIPPAFVDERYLKFFDYCNAHAALPIGLLRVPHGATDRSLPYVDTTPRAYDFVHAGDKAFVLATSVWFGEHGGESIKHDEEELEACVKVATRRGSAVFLPPPSDAKDPTRAAARGGPRASPWTSTRPSSRARPAPSRSAGREWLKEDGSDINGFDEDGWTLLTNAAWKAILDDDWDHSDSAPATPLISGFMVVALGSMQPFSALLLASALLACADDVPRYSRYYGDVSDNEPPAVAFALERVEVVEAGTAPIYVDVSDPDVDDDYAGVLDVTIESSLGGALAAATAAGLVFYDTNSTALRFRGPQALVRAALTPLTYAAPAVAGVSAEDAITVTVDDLGYTGTTRVLALRVTPVNAAPAVAAAPSVAVVAGRSSGALGASVADAGAASCGVAASARRGAVRIPAAPPARVVGGLFRGAVVVFEAAPRAASAVLAELSYVAPAEPGPDAVAIHVSDGVDEAEATVDVDVTAGPVEVAPTRLVASTNLLATAEDAAAPLSFLELESPRPHEIHEVAVFPPFGALKLTVDAAYHVERADGSVWIRGNASRASRALRGLVFNPDPGAHGVGYLAADLDGVPVDLRVAVDVRSVVDDLVLAGPPSLEAVAGSAAALAVALADPEGRDVALDVEVACAAGNVSVDAPAGVYVEAGDGVVTLRGGAARLGSALGALAYRASAPGADVVTVRVTDGVRSTSLNISVSVAEGADDDGDEFLAFDDGPATLYGAEDAPLTLGAAFVAVGLEDVEALTVSMTAAHGTLALGDADVDVMLIAPSGGAALVFRVAAAHANAALAAVVYSPAPDWFGEDALDATARAFRGHADGGTVASGVAVVVARRRRQRPAVALGALDVPAADVNVSLGAAIVVGDVDGGRGLLRVDVASQLGSLALKPTSAALVGASTTWDGVAVGTGPNEVSIVGSAARVNAALARVAYAYLSPARVDDVLAIVVADANPGATPVDPLALGLRTAATLVVPRPPVANAPPTAAASEARVDVAEDAVVAVRRSPSAARSQAFELLLDVAVTVDVAGATLALDDGAAGVDAAAAASGLAAQQRRARPRTTSVTVRGGPDAVSATRIFVSSDAAETVAITVDVVDGAGAAAPRAALARVRSAGARRGRRARIDPGDDRGRGGGPRAGLSRVRRQAPAVVAVLRAGLLRRRGGREAAGERGGVRRSRRRARRRASELAATLAKLVYVPALDDFGVDELLASVDGFATVAARSAVRVAAATDAPAFSGDAFLEVTLGRSAALGLNVADADGGDYLDVVLEVDRGALSAPAVDGCAEVNHRVVAVAAPVDALPFLRLLDPGGAALRSGVVRVDEDDRVALADVLSVGGLLAPESEDEPVVAYLAAGRGVFAYDAPEAPEDAFRISFAASDVDVFGAGGRVFKVRGTRRGLVAAMASIYYAPFPDVNGADTLRVGMAKRTDEASLSSSVLDVLAFVAPRRTRPSRRGAPAVAPVGAAAAASLALSVADADAGDALEVVVFASAGDVRLGSGAAVPRRLPGDDGVPARGLRGVAARARSSTSRARRTASTRPWPRRSTRARRTRARRVAVARGGSACGSAATAIDVVSQAGAGPALAVAPRGDVVVAGVLFEATEDVVAAVPPLFLSSASYSDAAYVNVSLALAFGSLAVDGVEGLELWSANASHLGFAGSRAAADAALANRFSAPPDFFGEWAPAARPSTRATPSPSRSPTPATPSPRSAADGRRSSPPSPRSAARVRDLGVAVVARVCRAGQRRADAGAGRRRRRRARGLRERHGALDGAPRGCRRGRRGLGSLEATVSVASGSLRLVRPGVRARRARRVDRGVPGPPARVADALAGAVEFLPAGPDSTVATIALRDRGCGAGGRPAAATLAVAVDPPAVALQWTSPAVVAGVEDAYVDLPAVELWRAGARVAPAVDAAAAACDDALCGDLADGVLVRSEALAASGAGDAATLAVRADHGAVAVLETPGGLDFFEPAERVRLRSTPSRRSATASRRRPDVSAAKANLVAALDDVETVGAGFSVAVERYDAEALDPTDDGGPLVARACAAAARPGASGDDAASASRRGATRRATTAPEVQRVAVRSNGTSTAGSFSLVYRAGAHDSRRTFADGAFETRRLPQNATARAVRDALEALPGVGLVDVAKVASDGDVALADYCWCGRCAAAGAAAAPAPGGRHGRADGADGRREPDVDVPDERADGDADGRADAGADARADGGGLRLRLLPEGARLGDHVLDVGRRRAAARRPLRLGRVRRVARALRLLRGAAARVARGDGRGAGVNRAAVATVQAGTAALGGEFALRWGSATTSDVSAASATPGHVCALRRSRRRFAAPGALRVTRSAPTREGASTWTVTFDARFGNVAPLAAVADRLAGRQRRARRRRARSRADLGAFGLVVASPSDAARTARTEPIDAAAPPGDVERALEAAARSRGFPSGRLFSVAAAPILTASTLGAWEATEAAARSYAILGAAAVPAAVDEVQTLRCAREVGDDADDGFRFVFRGLKSPKIRMGAAPVRELLPACPAADACRGDGSSLAEILEAWLRGAGVLGAGGSLAVASTGTTLCSDPAKGGAALPSAVGGFEARGWGLGAPTLTNITFLGGGPGGVGGDVDEFLVVKRAASNGTILELAEAAAAAAAVGESSVRGVFELGFRGATTAPLSHDASAGELAAALNALDTVGGGVTASRRPTADGRGFAWRVTFAAAAPTLGDLPLLDLASATCGDDGTLECFLRAGPQIAPDGTHDYGALGSSRVSVAEASPGTAPAWGTFAVRVTPAQPRDPRAGAPTAPLQLDASAATVEAALRRLDGAGRAEVALVDNPAAPFGPLWTVSGLDGGATLALEDVALVGAVDFCENCTSWAGCAPCGDAAAPAAPSLRTARLARDGAARGAPHAVAAALDRALFLPDADYNVLVDGFADVAFAVAAGGARTRSRRKYASRRSAQRPSSPAASATLVATEDAPLRLGAARLSVGDADARAAEGGDARLTTTLEVDRGTLTLARSRRLQVLEGYAGGGEARGSRIVVAGPSGPTTAALETLVYEPPRDYGSEQITAEVQRVVVGGVPSNVVQTVSARATGGAVVAGNFTLSLSCAYLRSGVVEVVARIGNASLFDDPAALARTYDRLRGALANATQEFTLAHDAPARRPRNASFEGLLQDALDGCAATGLDAARDLGLGVPARINESAHTHYLAGASVWRSELDDRDDSYAWEATILGAPRDFPALKVVANNATGRPAGLRAVPRVDGNLTFAMSDDAAPVVDVSVARPSALGDAFRLSFDGATTPDLPIDASSARVEEALERLATVGDVLVHRDYARSAVASDVFAWTVEFLASGSPAHVGPEVLLEAAGSGGVGVAVERVAAGAATGDRLAVSARRRAASPASPSTSSCAPSTTRPRCASPRPTRPWRMRPRRRVDDFFAGVAFAADDAAAVATARVTCAASACRVTAPPVAGVRVLQGDGAALALEGAPADLEVALRRGARARRGLYGVDVVAVELTDARGAAARASRSVAVAGVDDAPVVSATLAAASVAAGDRARRPPVAGVGGAVVRLTLSSANGTLAMDRVARRSLATWHAGDGDGGGRVLDATAHARAWNAALHYVAYTPHRAATADVVTATATDAAGLSSSVELAVTVTGATARTCASGLAVVADCGGATALRLLLLPAADDDDDDPARGGRVHFLDAASDVVEVMELPNGGLSLAAPGPTARLGAVQINAVLPRVAIAPPADFDGLARLSCVLEASGGDRSGVATRDFWVAVASENGAPELALSGARVEAAAAGDAALVVHAAARDVAVVDAARTDAFALGGLAVDADALLPAHGGAVAVADDADALLRVDVAVAWVSEPRAARPWR